MALPGADLPTAARLVRLRSALGTLPAALVRQVDDAVLMHRDPMTTRMTSAAAATDMMAGQQQEPSEWPSASNSTDTSSSSPGAAALSELDCLCTLLEVECPVWFEGKGEAVECSGGGGSRPDGTSSLPMMGRASSCGLDVDVLLNKAYLTLAMAGPEVWSSPHLLCRCEAGNGGAGNDL